MPRRLIKRYLPDPQKIRDHKALRCLGPLLQDPNILHLNRRSVSGAFAVGLFCALLPIPFQMLIAAIGAIIARVNLPISVVLVWVTNPLTIPPIFFFAHQVGTWILGTPELHIDFEFTAEWMTEELAIIWKPLLLGSLTVGVISAITGYVTIQVIWRRLVQSSWDRRCKQRHAARKAALKSAFQRASAKAKPEK